MKRIAVLCLAVIMALLSAQSVLAASGDFEANLRDYTGSVTYSGDTSGAYAVALIDADSQTILYQQNFDQQIEPASTTKIMTLILALENGDMDSDVTVSSNAAGQSGSHLNPKLKTGEKVNFEDLINGMMLASGNDAATAVAEAVSPDGTVAGFVSLMNAKAKEIGMENTTFTTPHGMHNESHVTTARDMAILTLYALQNPDFVKIVGQETYTMPGTNSSGQRVVQNTNWLMRTDKESYYYQYATGVKTGSTPYAGDCLVSSASKDGMNLICLVFKVNDGDTVRWTMTKSLFEWGFENFETVDLASLIKDVEPVQTTVEDASASDSGVIEFSNPEAGSVYVTLEKLTIEGILDGTDTVTVNAVYNTETLQAPIEKDTVLGTVTYTSTNTGIVIYQGSLIAPRDVVKAGTEPNSSGATAVETQTPVEPNQIKTPKDNSLIWLWLLVPAGLVAFLVIRLLTVNKRKRKRFKPRQPHYSYKIRR